MKFGKKILTVSEASEGLCPASDWLDYKHVRTKIIIWFHEEHFLYKYLQLKKLVKSCHLENNSASETDDQQIKSSQSEKAFFTYLLQELKKVTKAYRSMESTVLQNFLLFIHELEELKHSSNPSTDKLAHVGFCLDPLGSLD